MNVEKKMKHAVARSRSNAGLGELEALRNFHDFFVNHGTVLYSEFGMGAVDAYNAASAARRIHQRPARGEK
jgi:hypothetical protein